MAMRTSPNLSGRDAGAPDWGGRSSRLGRPELQIGKAGALKREAGAPIAHKVPENYVEVSWDFFPPSEPTALSLVYWPPTSRHFGGKCPGSSGELMQKG